MFVKIEECGRRPLELHLGNVSTHVSILHRYLRNCTLSYPLDLEVNPPVISLPFKCWCPHRPRIHELQAKLSHVSTAHSSCGTRGGKSLIPDLMSEIPHLLRPPTVLVILERIIVRDGIAVTIDSPGSRLEGVAGQVESVSRAGLFDVHAEVADDPARDNLYDRQKCPPQESVFFRREMFLGARGIGIDKSRGGM